MFKQFDFNTFVNAKQGECLTDKRGNDVLCFHTEPYVWMDEEDGLSVRFEFVSKYNNDPTTPMTITLYKRDFNNGE